MAETVNFSLDGLERFLEGIEKLKAIGERFASSMETAPKGRSKDVSHTRKAAQEMRSEQLKLLQSFTQILKRTAETYRLHDKQQEALEQADRRLRAKREEQIFRKEKLRQDTNEGLRAKRRNLKFVLQERQQRFEQAKAQYDSASESYYNRRQGASEQRLAEQDARLIRAKRYETEIAEEARARRKRERDEKRSEKRWANLQEFAIASTLAPFKLVGTLIAGLWKLTKNVLSISTIGKGAALAGNLVSNVSNMTFGSRAAGVPAFGSEYLAASFKGIFDAPALLQKITALRANPLDIAYPMMYGSGSRVGASPNEPPASSMTKLAEYAYGESRKYGKDIGLRRAIDPLLQQFSTEELLAMQNTPEASFKKRATTARSNFGIDESTLQSISDFDMSLTRLSLQIKAYFSTKLAPALEPLERLGKALVDVFDNILTDNKINSVVNYLIDNLGQLASFLQNDKTKEELDRIWNGLASTLSAGWDALKQVDWQGFASDIKSFASDINRFRESLPSFIDMTSTLSEGWEALKKIASDIGSFIAPIKSSVDKFLPSKALEKWLSIGSVSKGADIAERLMSDLQITPNQSAGIAGNLYHETGGFRSLQEKNPKSGRGGYGWAQWTGERREEFEKFAKVHELPIASDAANYLYLIETLLHGKYKDVLEKIKQTTSIADAEHEFMTGYEKPGIPAEESRLSAAIAIRKKLSNPEQDVPYPEMKDVPSQMLPMNMAGGGYNMPKPVSINLSVQDRQSSSSLGVQLDKVAGAIGGSLAFGNQFTSLQ